MIQTKSKTIAGLALMDVLLIAAACFIPAASHVFAFPLYVLNPMLALLLAGLAVGRDWRNALLLAVAMPLVSCLVVGMPSAAKMVCMIAELGTIAVLFGWLQNKWSVLASVLVSIVVGKLVYYGLKATVVGTAGLVGTSVWLQLAMVLVWGGLFTILYKAIRR